MGAVGSVIVFFLMMACIGVLECGDLKCTAAY